jgi:hypothetical protein
MRSLFGYLRTRDGVLALCLVLASGLALAFFTWRTFVDLPPRQYSLDFGQARWIEHAGVSPCAYFRKTLYISGNVERAWIEISATDEFVLYVNGIVVEKDLFAATRPAGIFDLKHLLRQGKNVISVYVPRIFYPGNAQLLVRGFYATETSPLTEFRSDAGWKVSKTPDGIIGSYQWFDPLLDDSLWADARETVSGEVFPTIQPVGIDPRIFARPPAAVWLGPKVSGALDATFESVETLPLAHGATWLQVAATGSYDVVINGALAVSQARPQQTKLPFAKLSPEVGQVAATGSYDVVTKGELAPSQARPQQTKLPFAKPSPEAGLASVPQAEIASVAPARPPTRAAVQSVNSGAATSAPTLLAYDVSRWMGTGANTIRIHVRCEFGVPAVLAQGDTELPGGAIKTFSTSAAWQVREQMPGGGSNGKAVVLGPYGTQPWSVLPQVAAGPQVLPAYDLRVLVERMLTIVLIEIFVVSLWLTTASWRTRTRGWSYKQGLTAGALLHLPTLAALMLCWLLSYDVRFSNNWCFTPGVVFAGFTLLFVSHLLLLFRGRPETNTPTSLRASSFRWKIVAFTAVTLLGFCLRLHDLNTMSLSSDEMMMIRNADGVISSGYPHAPRGTMDRILATYELTAYTLATSIALLGHTEFAYHLGALIFSTLTIALIGFVGTRMMDWRVGFISALIYACFPPSIAWARYGFYPSQEQFLALLTFWFFYEGIQGPELRARHLTLASISFTLGYLSWEGSGFILPALFVAMLAMRWGDNRWIKNWHLWRCFIVVSCIVVSQLAYRQLTIDSYDAVGFNLSDVTTPTLAYRNLLTYNPTYYIKVLFFSEVNFVISLFIFGGFLFCWGDRSIRYLVVVLFGLNLCYTNLLPFYAPRYCYNAQVLLILAGVGIFFKMRDRIAWLGGDHFPRGWPWMLRWSGAAALTIVFVLATNEYVVKSFRLSASALNPQLFARLGYYKTDHRAAAHFVAKRFQPGDGIITFMPHIFEYYSGKYSDYSINTLLNEKITYDGGRKYPQYLDKFLGRPLIRSVDEFRDVLTRFNRVWVVTPLDPETSVLSPDMSSFLNGNGRVVFESYRQQVLLVEGPQSAASIQRTGD